MSRGVVQKHVLDSFPPYCLYLRRNEEVLLGEEWDWTDDKNEAYVFPEYELAATASDSLSKQGELHVHAAVFGSDAERERHLSAKARQSSKEPHQPKRHPLKQQWREQQLERHQEILRRMHLD